MFFYYQRHKVICSKYKVIKKIRRLITGQGGDYTTGCLLDYE